MTRESIRSALRDFIVAQTNLEDPAMLQANTDLFAAGLIDSFTTISLAAFCEERFGSSLGVMDLSPENFRSLEAITDLVLQHQPELARE